VDTFTDPQKLIDTTVGVAAAFGTGACILAAPCGVGLFVVGASALYAGGLTAHYAASTPEERRQGMSKYLASTARKEATGALWGALCGRGLGGCFALGPKPGFPLDGVPRTQFIPAGAKYLGKQIIKWFS
jgi:hypothetical protein